MSEPTVNENSSGIFPFTIKDPDDVLADPPLVYKIDDVETGNSIRAETSVTSVSGALEITYTPDDTVILDQTNRVETRIITITANKGTSDQYIAEFKYYVKNLNFI